VTPRHGVRSVALALVALLLTAGCSGPLQVDAPRLSGADARVCRALVAALPARVSDQDRREVDTGSGYAAAWGDPAIELRCGVTRPQALDRFASCLVVDGVGWFIPDSQQQQSTPVDTTLTTVGRRVYVSVHVPAQYLPTAATMVDLGAAIRRTVPDVKPCQ